MKKLIMVVVMVALFAGAVGVGIHMQNKDLVAIPNHVVFVKQDGQQVFFEDVPVDISVLVDDDPNDLWAVRFGDTNADGKFASSDAPCAAAIHWIAEIEIPENWELAEGVNPREIVYPVFTTYFKLQPQ